MEQEKRRIELNRKADNHSQVIETCVSNAFNTLDNIFRNVTLSALNEVYLWIVRCFVTLTSYQDLKNSLIMLWMIIIFFVSCLFLKIKILWCVYLYLIFFAACKFGTSFDLHMTAFASKIGNEKSVDRLSDSHYSQSLKIKNRTLSLPMLLFWSKYKVRISTRCFQHQIPQLNEINNR